MDTQIEQIMKNTKSAVQRVKQMDFSDYKDDIAEQKRNDIIRTPRLAMLKHLRNQMDSVEREIGQVKGEILHRLDVKDESASRAELRGFLRGQEPAKRAKFINDAIQKGKEDVLTAIIEQPVGLLDDDQIDEFRRKAAFAVEPELEVREKAASKKYADIRKACGAINGEVVKYLMGEGITDPITYREFFETFPPRTEWEYAIATRKIMDEEAKQARVERDTETTPFDAAKKLREARR